MPGQNEIIVILVLAVGIYFLMRPPGWLKSFNNHTFITKHGGLHKNQKLLVHVRHIGKTLIEKNNLSDFDISINILNSKVINAFALPSGHIYLTLGIISLDHNEESIAAVLAHEIAHVAARHGLSKRQHELKTRIASFLLASVLPGKLFSNIIHFIFRGSSASYSQEKELEADALSIKYLFMAGYNPMAAYNSLRNLFELKNPAEQMKIPFSEFLATHPPSEARLKNAQHLARKYRRG